MVRWLIQAHLNVLYIAQPQFTENHEQSEIERELTAIYRETHGNATSNHEKHRKLTKTKSQLKGKHYKSSQQNQPRNHSDTTRARGKILRTHGNATSNHEKTPKNHENTKITQSKTL